MNVKRSVMCGVALMLFFLCASALLAQQKQPIVKKPGKPVFLRAQRTHLYLGKQEFLNVGVNIPDLFERFLNGQAQSGKISLQTAKGAGALFARCWGTTWGPDNFGVFEKEPLRWFAAFDAMLAAADAEGMTVVPSLLWNPHMLSEYVRRTTGKNEYIVDMLRSGSTSNALALRYVAAIVERYKNDARVLFWEIGNEYNLEADISLQHDAAEKRKPRAANQVPTSDDVHDFLVQIATRIKQIDKKHLVTSGNADMRPASWHLRQAMLAYREKTNPLDFPMDWRKDSFNQYQEMLAFFNPEPLDIISVHQYPAGNDPPGWLEPNDEYAFAIPWTRTAADSAAKPLFVGEFGQTVYVDGKEQNASWTHDFLKRLRAQTAPISAIWSWDFNLTDPNHAPMTLTPERTPILVKDMGAVNADLLSEITGQTKTPKP